MSPEKTPFEAWVRSSSTHWEGCWQAHLVCALERAVDLLDDYLPDMTGYGDRPLVPEAFIQYMRANR